MGRMHALAASTALLALGVKAEITYVGCAALDTSTIKTTTDLYPQGPAPCLTYCNSQGYQYAGITAQFCSCWQSPPAVTTSYTDSGHSDCSFNCDVPYNTSYCGGIDLGTLGFIYSYYAGIAPVGSSSSSVTGQTSTSPTSSIPSSSSFANVTASSSAGSSVVTTPTSTSALLPTTSSVTSPPGSSSPSSSVPSGVVTTPSSYGPSSSWSAPPSSTTSGVAPVVTIVALNPGQTFLISIAPFLRSPGDQALSWTPSPAWFLYSTNTTSFYGTVPLDFPLGPLIITVTAGQPTTGSNGPPARRQAPAATYTFAIELLIVAPVTSTSTSTAPTPTTTSAQTGSTTVPVLPSYTNTVYLTVTTTITRCPVCEPEPTVYAVPIGTTCITAEVFTTPCEVTVAHTRADGVVTPAVVTTASEIAYNPAESTVIVSTVADLTTRYTTTLLVAVTRTIQRLTATEEAGAAQPPPPSDAPGALPPPPPGSAGAGPYALPPPPAAAPGAGAVAPPPDGASGTGAANNGSEPAPAMPVTAGASVDRLVEMFVLLCGIAFGALLLL